MGLKIKLLSQLSANYYFEILDLHICVGEDLGLLACYTVSTDR